MNDHDRPTIEHVSNEKRPGNGLWWLLLALIGTSWVGYFYFEQPDWWALFLGLGSGAMLATWAIEITGNKVPDSWRRNR